MKFIDKDKLTILDKMFYNDEDTIITDIVDRILKFR